MEINNDKEYKKAMNRLDLLMDKPKRERGTKPVKREMESIVEAIIAWEKSTGTKGMSQDQRDVWNFYRIAACKNKLDVQFMHLFHRPSDHLLNWITEHGFTIVERGNPGNEVWTISWDDDVFHEVNHIDFFEE